MGLRRKKSVVEQAVDFVESAFDDAREAAGPMLADAREKASAAVAEGRQKAAPYVAQGAAFAAEQASAAREAAQQAASDAAERTQTKVAELKGEPPKKKHRLRKLVLFTGLGGLAVFAVKKLQGGSSDNWQSSYTPTPPASPTAAGGPADPVDDVAGATPGEAIADATEAPRPVSTPDDPAEVVDLDPGKPPA